MNLLIRRTQRHKLMRILDLATTSVQCFCYNCCCCFFYMHYNMHNGVVFVVDIDKCHTGIHMEQNTEKILKVVEMKRRRKKCGEYDEKLQTQMRDKLERRKKQPKKETHEKAHNIK